VYSRVGSEHRSNCPVRVCDREDVAFWMIEELVATSHACERSGRRAARERVGVLYVLLGVQ
jgi:hypothetical protein